MRTLATIISKSVGILLLTLLPVTGLAHTLEAPATVQAAADGSFSYEIVFTVGPGSVLIAGSGWTGVQNVPDQLHGDCFCFLPGCTAEEGEVSVLLVTSTLGDPTLPGLVRNWVAFCLESDIETFTTILPPFDGCGTLVQGAECVFFQADIGGLFRLEDYGGFNVGDVVRVTGVLNPDCTTICLHG